MITLSIALASITINPSDLDILSKSESGKILCENPDVVSKTCTSISSYTISKDGIYIENSETLISSDQILTVQNSVVVEIREATTCGVVDVEGIQKWIFRVNGIALPADRNSLEVAKLTEKLRPINGRKICEELRIKDGQLMQYGLAGWTDINLPGEPVSWIAPNDGYRVAPR